VNLLRERLFLAKREISIEIVPYVCCMQRMQHIFDRHQRNKKDELSSKERRLETLQNQTLRHVAEAFKRVSIETLETETYTSSLHVHLNMLQNKITLHSRVND